MTASKIPLKLAECSKLNLLHFFFDNGIEMRDSFLNFTKCKKKKVDFILISLMQSPRETDLTENPTGSCNTNNGIQKS